MMGIGPRIVDKPLVLYGKGKLGRLAVEIFNELGIRTISIDKDDVDLHGRKNKEVSLVAVCIVSSPYTPIAESLKSQGYKDIVPVWDIIEAYPEVGLHNGWIAGEMWKDEVLNIKFVYETWDDEMSRLHYSIFLQWRVVRKEREEDVLDSLATIPPPLPSTLKDIRNRQKAIGIHELRLHLDFSNVIAIHVEGYELKTIKTNMRLFKRYRPTIIVACYHSRDGLWEIEKTLMDNLPDYRWTFRLQFYQGQGAYLQGYPKENL